MRWTAEGLEYEADAGHRRRIIEAEGLKEVSKAVASSAVKEDNGKAELDEKDSVTDEHRSFRREGATLNYLGQDRSDIQYAVKEICQGMSRPTKGGKARIKRVARFLVGAKWLVWKYQEKQDDDEKVKGDVYVDFGWTSGWSRKSTSGGMLTVDGVGVKHWRRTQKARALISGEADYDAMVTGSAVPRRPLATEEAWASFAS